MKDDYIQLQIAQDFADTTLRLAALSKKRVAILKTPGTGRTKTRRLAENAAHIHRLNPNRLLSLIVDGKAICLAEKHIAREWRELKRAGAKARRAEVRKLIR